MGGHRRCLAVCTAAAAAALVATNISATNMTASDAATAHGLIATTRTNELHGEMHKDAPASSLPIDVAATCTTCADWCAGTCSFPRPPKAVVNADGTESITAFRMTPKNLTDLVDKDTGGARGDIMFSLYECSLPMHCRRRPGGCANSSSPTNTHSWLLDSPLVYAVQVVQTSGEWGPYMHCDVNLTVPFDPEPHFFCRGASPSIDVPDEQLCRHDSPCSKFRQSSNKMALITSTCCAVRVRGPLRPSAGSWSTAAAGRPAREL